MLVLLVLCMIPMTNAVLQCTCLVVHHPAFVNYWSCSSPSQILQSTITKFIVLYLNLGGFTPIMFLHWVVLYWILIRAEWVRAGWFRPGCIMYNKVLWSSICYGPARAGPLYEIRIWEVYAFLRDECIFLTLGKPRPIRTSSRLDVVYGICQGLLSDIVSIYIIIYFNGQYWLYTWYFILYVKIQHLLLIYVV